MRLAARTLRRERVLIGAYRGGMDTYEVVVVVAVKSAVREIVSPTTYDTLDEANAELAKITAAQKSDNEWPDVPWLSIKGTDVTAGFVRASERSGGLPTDIDALMKRMAKFIGATPADTDTKAAGDDNDESDPRTPPAPRSE